MRSYINLNADRRRNAKNDFERDTFKLMNNSIFSKTMENVRLGRSIKLVTKWDGRYGADVYLAKPNFNRYTIFETTDDFIAVELFNTNITFDKPIYARMSILDISKTKLYEFRYEYMKNTYEKYDLLYTDTDCLIYEVYTKDIYADMNKNIHRFDTSGYEPNNIYNIPSHNKKVLGVMKDENNGKFN